MKKFIFLLVWMPLMASSQTGLLHKVKDKVRARVDQRIDQGIDRSLDKSEERLERQASSAPVKNGWQMDDTAAGKQYETATAASSLQMYSRYDFMPGERIVFAEDFSGDVLGEFPLEWFTNNNGEVVTLS
ncbi:MAG TPA: hypothetical protein VGE66_18175, partial [Chitinophagaceae bacterium]